MYNRLVQLRIPSFLLVIIALFTLQALVLVPTVLPLIAQTNAQDTRSSIYINAGGSTQNVDLATWGACASSSDCAVPVVGGFAYTQQPLPSISGVVAPANESLYQTEWTGGKPTGEGSGDPAFEFDIPVANGGYKVRLHFAELNKNGAGQRVFDVALQDQTVLTNFDIWAEAGGINRAIVREFPVGVNNGNIKLDFFAKVENAKVSAIEIVPTDDPVPPPPPTVPDRIFTWNPAAPAPTKRVEGAGVVINGKLFVFAGFYTTDLQATKHVEVFDPVSKTWSTRGEMPLEVTHIVPAVDGTDVWIAGGFEGQHPGAAIAAVWKYDSVADTWNPGPALPEPRAGGLLVRVDRSLHYIGGFKADRDTTVGDHWVLDIDGGTSWQNAAPLAIPRGHTSGVVLDGKIYVIGGQHGHDKNPVDLDAVSVYDPQTDTWAVAPPLPWPRSHAEPGTFIKNGRIYVVGGRNNTIPGEGRLDRVTMYDPATEVWIALPPIPQDRLAPVAQPIENEVIVNGGGKQWNNPQNETYIGVYDDTWETQHPSAPQGIPAAASGIVGRYMFTVGAEISATLAYDLSRDSWTTDRAQRPFIGAEHAGEVYDGKFYLFGGTGESADKVQIYDPSADTWSLGAPMPFAVQGSAAALINGEIYLAGGRTQTTVTNAVAKYNPRTDTWTPLEAMAAGYTNAAAGTDGTNLYLFGGRTTAADGTSVVTTTVQMYDPRTDSWTTSLDANSPLQPLPQARSGVSRAVCSQNSFYLVGGANGAQAQPTAEVDIYNLEDHTWAQGAAMPAARSGTAPVIIADRIYVAGGTTLDGQAALKLDVYNIGSYTGASGPTAETPTVGPVASPTPTTTPSGGIDIVPTPGQCNAPCASGQLPYTQNLPLLSQ